MGLVALIFSTVLAWSACTALPSGDKVRASEAGRQIKLKKATLLGPAIDPKLNRDACGSTHWGSRILWVCRDTQMVTPSGEVEHFWAGSASYSDMTPNGPPFVKITPGSVVQDNKGYERELLLYGNNNDMPFYVLSKNYCGTAANGDQGKTGTCPNGNRYPRSPDSPPRITHHDEKTGAITAYTWIKNKLHSDNTNVVHEPSTALYKITWSPEVQGAQSSALPKTEFVGDTFFQTGEFAYGAAGHVLIGEMVYLWAQSSTGTTSLARVSVDGVEDRSNYEYYVNGGWTRDMPASVHVEGAAIECTAGGQGTFYYSDTWDKYVWIGGDVGEVNGKFFISTAPKPEGPWTTPYQFWTAPPGDNSLPTYGFQAHPDLRTDKKSSDIYISYTKNMVTGFETPVYLVEWDD